MSFLYKSTGLKPEFIKLMAENTLASPFFKIDSKILYPIYPNSDIFTEYQPLTYFINKIPTSKGFYVPLHHQKPYQNALQNPSKKQLHITPYPITQFYHRVIIHLILGQ